MNAVAGASRLIRLILRRDRFLFPLWMGYTALFSAAAPLAFEGLFPSEAARLAYANGVAANPSITALLGPAFGTSIGALTAQRVSIAAPIVAVISALTVIRHTRADEEVGRRDLLGATVVGRHAPLAAALATTVVADLVLAVLIAAVLVAIGQPAAGAVAFGLFIGLAGALFAAVGAVCAQLTEGARPARGIALSVLGAAFLLRAAGDAGGADGAASWLAWLSPLGLLQRSRPFAGERWWVFAVVVAMSAALAAVAAVIAARRDVGAGVFASRLGPAGAGPRLDSPLTLAWRLQRGALLGWTVGFAVAGAVFGGVGRTVTELLESNPRFAAVLEAMGRGSVTDVWLSTMMGVLAILASAYAIGAALRLRAEEEALRAELVLATNVARHRWTASHSIFSGAGPVVLMAVAGMVAGLANGADAGALSERVADGITAGLVQLPAVWVLAGLTLALHGLHPRLAAASWGVLGLCVFISQLGPVLQLPQWVLDVSPFTHTPPVTGGALPVAPLLAQTAVAAALTVLGFAAFRRRDVA